MRKIKFISVCIVTLFITGACKKNGTGGDATIVVFLEHHGRNIKNHKGYPDTVFVKFNAKDAPGIKASDYDTFFVGEEGEDHIHCKDLLPGTYFLFGAGFDSSIVQRVTGGMSVKISRKERKQETDVNLAVSE